MAATLNDLRAGIGAWHEMCDALAAAGDYPGKGHDARTLGADAIQLLSAAAPVLEALGELIDQTIVTKTFEEAGGAFTCGEAEALAVLLNLAKPGLGDLLLRSHLGDDYDGGDTHRGASTINEVEALVEADQVAQTYFVDGPVDHNEDGFTCDEIGAIAARWDVDGATLLRNLVARRGEINGA